MHRLRNRPETGKGTEFFKDVRQQQAPLLLQWQSFTCQCNTMACKAQGMEELSAQRIRAKAGFITLIACLPSITKLQGNIQAGTDHTQPGGYFMGLQTTSLSNNMQSGMAMEGQDKRVSLTEKLQGG